MGKLCILNLPGGGNSGPDHWQSYWESQDQGITRVVQSNWVDGTRTEWVETLDRYVQSSRFPVILVAHSVGNMALLHWAATCDTQKVAGALLVAPADVDAPWGLQDKLYREFRPVPSSLLPFPSILVASTDDPYLSVERAEKLSVAWGSSLFFAGALGHIGSDSKLKYWEQGQELLEQLVRSEK